MKDYNKLGFKAGLEIHQQLDTKKLFIRTKSELDEENNFQITRKLRPVASELSEFDKTSIDAFKRNETFRYFGKKENISLIEIDEEPPQPLDQDALSTVLEICAMCNSKIVNELQPMRKTVIDGSNTSAFQRTVLVSLGGQIKLENKNITIETIILEEDACRPIKKEKEEVHYNLDRLGIPLIELATAPEISNPKEAYLTARKIGEIMRLTGKTKRGKGTIRQDINVSIKDGNRVEIKGCQDLELIQTIIEKEIDRQIDLIDLKDELKNKYKNKETIFCQIKELTKIFNKTECNFLKNKEIYGFKLNDAKGILGRKVGDKRFASELSDYAKSIKVTGLIHLDELPNYGINENEIYSIKKELDCNEKDNFIIFATTKEKSKEAQKIIKERFFQAFEEVPKETRGANEDGSSTYQRPLSSSARMYPETDILNQEINEDLINKIKNNLPKNAQEREEYYLKLGLSTNHIQEMKLNNRARFFEKLVEKKCNPVVSATLLLQTLTELKRKNIQIEKINDEEIEELLILESKNKINKNNLNQALIELTNGKTIKEIIENQNNELPKEEIKKIIDKIIEKNEELIKNKKFGAIGALVGDLSKENSLKMIDKKIISDILKNEIDKKIKSFL
jgi:glutamyl-tRNA(Gln) amidotransferase subunit E